MLLKPDLSRELAIALPLCLILVANTHTHMLSCNTAPGVFPKLTKKTPHVHTPDSIFFAAYLSLFYLSCNLLCLSSWIMKKLLLSHGTATFKWNIMQLKSAGCPHVRLLDAETEDWLLTLHIPNIHFDEGKIINRLLLLTAALMLMRKDCYFWNSKLAAPEGSAGEFRCPQGAGF